MDTPLDVPPQRPQTSAQFAVRWFALVATALLLASVPFVHLLWHGVLGHDEPPVLTRSQVPAPALTREALRDGSWMLGKERQLREGSPVVWWLRGAWNELRYRAGVPESRQVHFGKDEWFFIQEEVWPDRAAFERARPNRLRFLAALRDLVRKSGAELFVFVNPDKSRIYPDYCYAGGVMPEDKQDNYAAILADLAAADIPTADLAAAIAAARAADPRPASPELELYYRRDTHWRPQGVLAATRAEAAAIEARCGAKLGPRAEARLSGKTEVRVLCDLPANMGIRTAEMPEPLLVGRTRTAPMSFLAEHLSEVKEYYGVELRRDAGFVAMSGKDQSAEVLLIGASFAEENGANGLALWLGRSVRVNVHLGATGLASLREMLPELRAGTKAKVVVWDVVERGFFTADWTGPTLLDVLAELR